MYQPLAKKKKLDCRNVFSTHMDAFFDWEPVDPASYGQVIDQTTIGSAGKKEDMTRLGTTDLNITLTTRKLTHITSSRMNEQWLTDDAFSPKRYTIRLEKGPFGLTDSRNNVVQQGYGLQLTFNTSPFPPREEWKSDKGARVQWRFWEACQFVRADDDSHPKNILA